MSRDKSNLVPPENPKPKLRIASPEERQGFLSILGMFRIFDLYFFGMQEE